MPLFFTQVYHYRVNVCAEYRRYTVGENRFLYDMYVTFNPMKIYKKGILCRRFFMRVNPLGALVFELVTKISRVASILQRKKRLFRKYESFFSFQEILSQIIPVKKNDYAKSLNFL